MDRVRLLIYGDHLGDKVRAFQRVSALSRARPLIKDFLDRAADSLKGLTIDLTPAERAQLGGFEGLEDLAATFESSEAPSEAASFALTIAAQVADLLHYCLNDQTGLGSANVQHFGICLGHLTACLAASAGSIDEVSRWGLDLIGVAFRLGLACQRRSRSIEDAAGSWARTFINVDLDVVKKAVETANEEMPSYSHVSLGVVTNDWTSVFGPPTSLERLAALPALSAVISSTPKVSSYVHAPQLSSLDMEFVLGSAPILEAPFSRKSTVAPLSDGISRSETLREALQSTVFAIASQALCLEQVTQSVAARLEDRATVEIINIGPSTHSSLITKTLQREKPDANVTEHKIPAPNPNDDDKNRIAIVGMSGRFPHAENLEEFWSLLEAGLATHEKIPASRFSVADFHDPHGGGKNTTLARFGCFLQNPGMFDNAFFNISPKEAMQMEPLQRMLLMATYEALQQAGYSPDSTPSTQASRIATFFGQTSSDWEKISEQQGIDTHYIPGTNRAFTPGRLNHFFQWGAGYYSIDTACSASSTSMHLASNALLARECDTAVVGGGQLCAVPDMFAGLSSGGFLSSTGACKTFADDADGYCRGEAVGVVVLKRLSDALRDNDNVLAVVRGCARNTNSVHGSIVSPHQPAQEALFRKVLRQSNVRADDVSYVEMHGTGTQAGDMAEMESVMNIFSKPNGAQLHIGAVKANVGHSEAAAGIVALIKTVLMLQRGTIPPQPAQPFTLNPHFRSLEKANIAIPERNVPWEVKIGGKRIALINGFDAAGGNTSILLEEGGTQTAATADLRTQHVVAVSGHTLSSLQANKQRLLSYLQSHPDTRLCDLSYTTTARRMHERLREAYAVSSVDALTESLGSRSPSRAAPPAKNVAFLFTGQSSQYAGMGSLLYQTSARFRGILDSYQTVCSGLGLPRFVDMIRGLLGLTIATTPQHHLAIVALEIALAEFWSSLGIRADLVIGHSLGEYAALCVAGILSVSSTLYLVHKRAELMDAKCGDTTYGMLATGLSANAAKDQINKHSWKCEIACSNSPSSTVLSGEASELASVEAELKANGTSAIALTVTYGFHSRQMDPILDDFEDIAKQVRFDAPRIPVASTCTGKLVRDPGVFNASYLRDQTRQPVDFVGAVQACEKEDLLTSTTFAIEIGPHPICTRLLPSCIAPSSPRCFASLQRDKEDWAVLGQTLAGAYEANLPVNWTALHSDFRDSVRLLDLPTYSWNLTSFWASYQSRSEVQATPSITAPISPSVQRVESLRREDGRLTAIFLSNTSEPVLYQAIQGHTVSGVAICPASVFADMAYTTARFLYEKEGADVELTQMQLCDLKMIQALLMPVKDSTQIIRITAILDLSDKTVSVRFQSVDGVSASGIVDHGHATITVSDKTASHRHWARMRRLVQDRASSLARSPQAHRLTTPLLYKLFAGVVNYSKPYQALREAHVDESFQDAMATIALESSAVAEVGNFTYSPFILDALIHLAGFLLNADLNRTDSDLHMANSIGEVSILEPLKADHRDCAVYASVREHDARTGVSMCDVFVWDQLSGNAVALCSDIRFQHLPPEVFSALVLRQPEPEQKSVRPAIWTPETTPAQSGSRASSRAVKRPNRSKILLELTADELGMDINHFQADTEFESLGLHSMAVLKIMAAFKKQTGLELPVGIFAENGTVGRLRAVLHDVLEDEQPEEEEAQVQPTVKEGPSTPAPVPFRPAEPIPDAEMVASAPAVLQDVYTGPWQGIPKNFTGPVPEGRVVLVQGERGSTLPPLFMATAGIGLAAPYIRFPRLANGRPIYALESPYVECPEMHPHSAEAISEAWIKSIKRIARKGPYIIGGYSAGGAFAFEIARQLSNAGETVAGLLIIDCRVPQPVPAAYDIIAIPVNATGLTPKNKAHMIAGARTLVRFDPQPFEAGREPCRTHIIWGEGGESNGGYGRAAMGPVGEGRPSKDMTFDEYQTELNQWFCGDRAKEMFDTNGWERFVGGKERMKVHSVPGNHSSMMRPPQVKRIGEVVVEFVEDITRVEAELMQSIGSVR